MRDIFINGCNMPVEEAIKHLTDDDIDTGAYAPQTIIDMRDLIIDFLNDSYIIYGRIKTPEEIFGKFAAYEHSVYYPKDFLAMANDKTEFILHPFGDNKFKFSNGSNDFTLLSNWVEITRRVKK